MSPRRWALKKKWYQQLKDLLTNLEANSMQAVLRDEDLGIQLMELSAENDEEYNVDFDSRFFTPLRREGLPVSPCEPSLYDPDDNDEHPSFWPRELHELQNDYLDGRELADSLAAHLSKLTDQRRWTWQRTA